MKATQRVTSAKVPIPPSKPGGGTIAMVTPSIVIPQGDGVVLVKPGRPVEVLTVLQFAKAVGYSRSAVYEKVGSPCLPERFIRRTGPRLIWIRAEAVEFFLDYWRNQRDGGIIPD